MRTDLVEAHAHIGAYGESLSLPDGGACDSREALLDLVRQEAARGQRMIRIRDARPEGWSAAGWPSLEELDRAAGASCCVVRSFDRHSAVANSNAMTKAGLRPGECVGESGLVVATDDGEPTGLLLEAAAVAAWESGPAATDADRLAWVRSALYSLKNLGYREVHDMDAPQWLGPTIARLQAEEPIDIDVRLYAPVAELESRHAGRTAWETERVCLAGGKIYSDGALNSRTAWMLEPYAEPLPGMERGTPLVSPEQLDEWYRLSHRLDLPLAIHAIGDAAVRLVLDAAERNGVVHGTRIEHAELIHPDDITRFAALGVLCSVQPCHLLVDIEVLERQLADRLERVLPLRSLVQSGLAPGEGLVFGSDVPIVRADPEDSILAAVERGRTGDPGRIAPAEALTEDEAWACFSGRAFR